MHPTQINPRNYDVVVGIDVSEKSNSITYQDHGFKGKSLKMPSDPQVLINYAEKRFPGKRLLFAYEAGPTGYHLHDTLAAQNYDCLVIHPASVEVAPNQRVKTNRIDSSKITDQVQSGQLTGIRVPPEAYRELRHLTGIRQQYARESRRAKQRIDSLLLFEHVIAPQLQGIKPWSARFTQVLRTLKLKDTVRLKLDLLLGDLDYARKRIALIQRKMRAFLRAHPEIRTNFTLLKSIPGFGFVVPLYLLARVGDPERLSDVRELGAFSGLVPSEDSTGDRVQRGSITHMGDRELRTLLIEAAWVAIRSDKELKNVYHRIKARHRGKGNGAKKIAITAVARRLTARAYTVLKEQRPYVVH